MLNELEAITEGDMFPARFARRCVMLSDCCSWVQPREDGEVSGMYTCGSADFV